jgi:hypothetical protein
MYQKKITPHTLNKKEYHFILHTLLNHPEGLELKQLTYLLVGEHKLQQLHTQHKSYLSKKTIRTLRAHHGIHKKCLIKSPHLLSQHLRTLKTSNLITQTHTRYHITPQGQQILLLQEKNNPITQQNYFKQETLITNHLTLITEQDFIEAYTTTPEIHTKTDTLLQELEHTWKKLTTLIYTYHKNECKKTIQYYETQIKNPTTLQHTLPENSDLETVLNILKDHIKIYKKIMETQPRTMLLLNTIHQPTPEAFYHFINETDLHDSFEEIQNYYRYSLE